MLEKPAFRINGFVAILFILGCIGGSLAAFATLSLPGLIFGTALALVGALLISGITIIQPNNCRAVTFFGSYVGSIRESGIWLTVPLSLRKSVSLRVSNFNSKTLKVNDVAGNPIEIAAVIVFRVVDSARALFDVENYEQFVEIQSETALRHIATQYPYDTFEETGYSLRGNSNEVAQQLSQELQERLSVAGVEVIEARLTHLAYATEIASAMLQRQQANAILSARQIIVEGAVGMAQMAITQLQRENIVELDEERKMAMINNLMVAIISERGAQPIINTGTLY